MSIDKASRTRGRQRDGAIDARVLEAANHQLAAGGYEALSLSAVAQEACTTRQALYRRWPTKVELVADAIRAAGDEATTADSDDPRHDLELELTDFRRAISRPGALSLAATMLQDSTHAASRECYRTHVINPRGRRIRQILERARHMGLIDPEADVETAAGIPAGSWFGRQLAGEEVSADWAQRTAALVWRSVGGRS